MDKANDLALLKAVGAFKPLPIAASRTVKLGGTVAAVGFPDIGLQGFAPRLAKGEIASLSGAADDARYFQISAGRDAFHRVHNWWSPNKRGRCGKRPYQLMSGALPESCGRPPIELRGEERFSAGLPRIRPRLLGQAQGTGHGGPEV